MKKFALPLALTAAIALQACNQQQNAAPKEAATAPATTAAPATAALETTQQRLSYGIAYGLGQRMKADNVPLDVDAFSAGMRDAISGTESRLSQEEIAAEMQAFQEKAMAEHEAKQAAAATENLAAANKFLEENKAREGVVVTDSGLQYEIITKGEGPIPGPEDTVEVNYRGTLIDGTEFDSSYKRGQSVSFGVGQVIAGWTEALQLMPVGSKWRLVLPPDLAYGTGGAGQQIGPNSALVFEVELLDIAEPDAEGETPKPATGAN